MIILREFDLLKNMQIFVFGCVHILGPFHLNIDTNVGYIDTYVGYIDTYVGYRYEIP